MSSSSIESAPWPRPRDWPTFLFGLAAPTRRREYAVFGVGLMLFKYAVEAAVIAATTGRFYTPLDFVNPLLISRQKFTIDAPEWLGMAWVLWTLPFLWIALSMTVRRAAQLGYSPWWGLIVLAPVINLVAMVVFALLPDPLTKAELAREEEIDRELTLAYRPPAEAAFPPQRVASRPVGIKAVSAAALGLVGGAGFLVVMVLTQIYLLHSYGGALFFGTPIITGAIASYCLNTPVRMSLGFTLLHGLMTIVAACCGFLFIGLEGAICILMALPIMAPLGLFGSLLGYAIASGLRGSRRDESPGLMGAVVVLPLFGFAESYLQPQPTFEVMTAIEIAAPPEAVWREVVQFSEITEPPEWYFQLGIASPQRARIEGEGVGAVRYCEFTTGVFVEPITTWDPPRRLAFDVSEQPHPMFELTPYRHIHPPHLDGAFRSVRGEFLIIPLAAGRTRLEGRTWYQLEIHPLSYWTVWSDALVHRIHGRVLRHIRREAERR